MEGRREGSGREAGREGGRKEGREQIRYVKRDDGGKEEGKLIPAT